MKQLHLIALYLFVFSHVSYAQGWKWIQPTPQGNDLNDIQMVTESIVYAVGDKGAVLKSTDAGTSWSLQKSGTDTDLQAVFFVNENTGSIVGNEGTVLRTTNGGATWNRQTISTNKNMIDVHFCNEDVGMAIAEGEAGEIYRTTNGGASWNILPPGISSPTHNLAVWVFNKNDAVIFSLRHGPTHTDDGGITWTVNTGMAFIVWHDVDFVDDMTGYAVIEPGQVLKTVDGGTNWEVIFTYSEYFMGIVLNSKGQVTVVGMNGVVFCSNDGGVTWSRRAKDIGDVDLLSVSMNGTNVVIVGEGGAIYTADIGLQETTQRQQADDESYNAFTFIDGTTGIIVGSGGSILKTTNNGEIWEEKESNTSATLFGVHFVSDKDGFAVGDDVLSTNDGGETWILQYTAPDRWWFGVAFADCDNGIVVGEHGVVARTSDRGATWEHPESGVTGRLFEVALLDRDLAVAVGQNGCILRSTDFGDTWQDVSPNGYDIDYYDVCIYDEANIFVVGEQGTILFSSDGAMTWNKLSSGTSVDLFDVHIVDAHMSYACGMEGSILRTIDGGTTWELQDSFASEDLWAVAFADADHGVAVGSHGTILRTTTGGVTHGTPPIAVPVSMTIAQNYPNPMSSSCQIEYFLPMSEYINLSVYDIHGRLIRTLVNERKMVGTHVAHFHAGSLPSGAYFLHLSSNDDLVTKIMQIIK